MLQGHWNRHPAIVPDVGFITLHTRFRRHEFSSTSKVPNRSPQILSGILSPTFTESTTAEVPSHSDSTVTAKISSAVNRLVGISMHLLTSFRAPVLEITSHLAEMENGLTSLAAF